MKKYYLGMHYNIHLEEFPHMGIAGAICWNSDCTAEIYINALYCRERQMKAIRHELRHFVYDHAFCDYKDLVDKESEADDEEDENVVFADDFSWVLIKDESLSWAS